MRVLQGFHNQGLRFLEGSLFFRVWGLGFVPYALRVCVFVALRAPGVTRFVGLVFSVV